MLINPDDHDYPNIRKLTVGSILPQPIAVVSTLSKDGLRNLAPF